MIISKSISQITIQYVLFQSASNCGARHFARLAFKISDYTSRLSSETMFLLKFYWKRQYRLIGPNLRSSEFPLSASQLKLCHLQWHIQFGVSWYHKLMVQIWLKKKEMLIFGSITSDVKILTLSPNQALTRNGFDCFFHVFHIRLIIPRFDI